MGFETVTPITVGGSANLPTTNELPVDISARRYEAFPELTPLTSMLSKMETDKARNFRVDIIEAGEIPFKFILAADIAASGTTMVVHDNAEALVSTSLVYNADRDDFATVTTTGTSSNSVTIVRAGAVVPGSNVAWYAGDVIYNLGPKLPENDTTDRPLSVADNNVYNLVELTKVQFGITNMMDSLPTVYGGPGSKTAVLKQQMYRHFRIISELSTIMGGRATSGTAPATLRFAGGLRYFLKNGTLYKNFGGTMTQTGFRNLLGDYKDQNPDSTNVVIIAAGAVIDLIDGFGLQHLQLDPMSDTMGLDILTYRSRGLSAKLVPHPLFTSGAARGWGFILDFDRIRRKILDPETYYPWDRNKGQGEVQYHAYRGISSLLLANESRHVMFEGANS
jgi:hypothetical protein